MVAQHAEPEGRVPLGSFAPQVMLYSDASLVSWGAHSEDFLASGTWTEEERTLSINALELLAVIRALQTDPTHWRGLRILIASDNTSTVAYFNHQGGTHSMTLMDLTYNLYEVVQLLGASIRARHIPGRLNRTADLLSRSHQIVNTEWTLHRAVTARIWEIWG